MLEIENEFNILNEDERFNGKKIENLDFEEIDRVLTFSANYRDERLDDSEN